jgi:type II secretory pathway component PulM
MGMAPRARLPWMLVAASVLLAVLLGYTLVGGYLPAKRRVASLERELRDVYAREGELQRRLEDLERQLAAARGQKR